MSQAASLQLGLELRDQGIESVSRNNDQWLKAMRARARQIARARGTVSSDDIHEYADALGWHPNHRNAFGAIFRVGFRHVDWMKSTRPEARGRDIKTWAIV